MKIILDRKLRWAFLLSVLVVTACDLGSSKGDAGNSSSKSGSSPGASAFSPSNDPRKDLSDALDKLSTAYPFRMNEVWSGNVNGQEIKVTGGVNFAAADRSHAKLNDPRGDMEMITIGDKQYSRLNNGNWTEGEAYLAPQSPGTVEVMRKMLASVIKDVKYTGPETVNGVACHAYAYTIDGDLSGQKWLGTGKSWILAKDGLPHQSDAEVNLGAYKAKSHETYEYNVEFKVEKPAM